MSGKADLGLFCPPSRYIKIFASFPKIIIIDITEMTHRTGVCETCDLRLFLEAQVQPGFRSMNTFERKSGPRFYLIPTYFKIVMDFTGE